MADEPKLVTALEVRLNAFEKQLKEAGLIAEREVKKIEDTFSKANPVFGGTFLGTFLGNVARDAAKEITKAVFDLVDRFKDLEKAAKLANVAMQDLFGLQEAAHKLGAPINEVTSSVRNLAELLDQMKRGEVNSLSKLLDANPAALKGMNREALTFAQTMGIVANLVQNADTTIQKIDIARMAGQAESMVPALEKGAKALAAAQKAAADAAPDLQKLANLAKDFDKAWDDAIKKFKAYLLTDGLQAMREFLATVSGWLLIIAEGMQKVTFGPVLPKLVEATDKIRTLNTQLKESAGIATFDQRFAGDRTLAAPRSGDVAGGGTTTFDPTRPTTNVPLRTQPVIEDRTRLDASIDRIEKRTAAINAETEAIDLSTQAREEAKIKAELMTVAEQQLGGATAEQIERINAIAAAYGRAAAAIEQARSPLATFARESANLGKMMNDFAANSLNNMTNELANVVTGTKTAAEAFGAMAKSIANDLAKIAIRQAITGPLAQLFGLSGGFAVGGGSAGLFSPGALSGGFAAASGGTFGAGRWGVVGERGPELIQTHTGGGVSIYPNGKLPGFADGGFLPAPVGGGASVQGAQITINAPGADKAGLARVEAEVIKLNRTLETRAVRAVSDASSRGHTVITRR
jgi:Lambda phage tail tape-measure protein (Tape_meas_lam_C)